MSHKCCDFNGVDDAVLLNTISTWPLGTLGHKKEQELVRTLNALCKEHGYGAVPQIAAMIEEIWRCPEKIEQYKKVSFERRELLESLRHA